MLMAALFGPAAAAAVRSLQFLHGHRSQTIYDTSLPINHVSANTEKRMRATDANWFAGVPRLPSCQVVRVEVSCCLPRSF